MEVALSKPFLGSETVYSSLTSIDDGVFNEEIFRCVTYLKLSLNEIYDMPTSMRRNFIRLNNKEVEKENKSMNR